VETVRGVDIEWPLPPIEAARGFSTERPEKAARGLDMELLDKSTQTHAEAARVDIEQPHLVQKQQEES
jgi:hypothetical protein